VNNLKFLHSKLKVVNFNLAKKNRKLTNPTISDFKSTITKYTMNESVHNSGKSSAFPLP